MPFTTNHQIIRECFVKKNEILEFADESRKTGICADVCIKAAEKSFRAHRLILSCYSEYFRVMFRTDMIEKHGDTVEIKGVDATSLEFLIDFIYTEKICINEENVFKLLAASDYLQIGKAKQLCFDFLTHLISVETWFDLLIVVNLHGNDNFLKELFRFLNDNFAEISSRKDFKVQSKQNLVYVLSQRDSYRVKERLVYDAIIEWVKYDENRKDDLAELFQHLDLSKFSLSFFTNTVSTESLVIKNCFCLSLAMNALAMKLQESNSIKLKILCISNTSNNIFAVYNSDHQVYPALPHHFYPIYSLKFENFIYCFGEVSEDTISLRKVLRMKLCETNMEWEEIASMKEERFLEIAAVYRNGIAVMSQNWNDTKNSIEFYIPSLNQWSSLPSICVDRRDHELVSSNGCLFCLGGTNNDDKDDNDDDFCDRRSLSSVEMLSDVNGTWRQVQPMQTPRKKFTAVDCIDTIYAIGGRNDQHRAMKSVEKYDYRLNKWIYVKDMNIERRGHSACVMQDKIFVVGGQKANLRYVSEIECYDPLLDNWSIVANSHKKCYLDSVVAI